MLFSLNSSTYGKLAAQLGALAIQDLTSAAGRRLERPGHGVPVPATIALDEFSALGADNVLSLLARGREAGVSVLLATQELADLERAGPGFRDQVLGITALKLAHRQEVDASAVAISRLAGTERVWRETRQLPSLQRRPARQPGHPARGRGAGRPSQRDQAAVDRPTGAAVQRADTAGGADDGRAHGGTVAHGHAPRPSAIRRRRG